MSNKPKKINGRLVKPKHESVGEPRRCSVCNCEISNKNITGLCRSCNMTGILEFKWQNPMEQIPIYVRNRFYQIKNKSPLLKDYSVRKFFDLLKTTDYIYEYGDFIGVENNCIVIIRGAESHHIKIPEE